MDTTIIEAFQDELQKLAVSEDWVRRHAYRGQLQQATYAVRHNVPTLTTRKGRRRSVRFDKRVVNHRHYGALRQAARDALDDFEKGKRLYRVGPHPIIKHWKKGVGGLGLAGLLAAAYALRKKKKKANRGS